jgi:hypothetical protein
MASLLRIGTKVRTIDGGARVHGRPPDKPEATGTIQDHHRPYGRQSKDRTPPYYVTFETGEAAWYDASEVERLRGSRSGHPATPPAQLEREIAEVLERPAGSAASNPFEEAKAEHDLIEKEVEAASEVLQTFPKSLLGGVRDDVSVSPEFRAANVRFQKAFARLRAFNTIYVKRFAKELRAERAKRYGSH